MFKIPRGQAALLFIATIVLAGCAGDGGPAGTTSSIAEPTAARVDSACVSLAAQIDQLNKEGTPDRLAQASSGKTATVPVKRDALAKQAQLNKANTDFRARCSTITPKSPQQAAIVPVAPAVAAAGAGAAVGVAPAVAAKAPRVKAEPRSALEEALSSDTRQ